MANGADILDNSGQRRRSSGLRFQASSAPRISLQFQAAAPFSLDSGDNDLAGLRHLQPWPLLSLSLASVAPASDLTPATSFSSGELPSGQISDTSD